MMKQIIHLYNDTEINFVISNADKDVIINASQMANVFDKSTKDFLKLKETDKFIIALLRQLNSDADGLKYSNEDIIFTKDDSIFMHRKLAIHFAAWLNMEFGIWFFETVDDILFGNYKKHWVAHAKQKSSQVIMDELKRRLLLKPTEGDVRAYFQAEKEFNNAKMAKLRAIKDQYSLELEFD